MAVQESVQKQQDMVSFTFAREMLAAKGDSFKGKTVAISGSGNVAQFACEKVLHLGGKPVTMSDSSIRTCQ